MADQLAYPQQPTAQCDPGQPCAFGTPQQPGYGQAASDLWGGLKRLYQLPEILSGRTPINPPPKQQQKQPGQP